MGLFLHIGNSEVLGKLNYKKDILNKPKEGFWGCIYTPDKEYKSDWHCYLINSIGEDDKEFLGVTFDIKITANLLIIDSYKDYKKMKDKYPNANRVINKIFADDEYFDELCGISGWESIDYVKIAKEYDGIFLTVNGIRENYHSMYGWDVNSIVIFNLGIIVNEEGVKIEKGTKDKGRS